MVAVYLLLSVRYFPGKIMLTLVETATQILSMAPVNIGATMFLVIILQKLTGEKMLKSRIARIFLLVAITIELLVNLSLYMGQGAAV